MTFVDFCHLVRGNDNDLSNVYKNCKSQQVVNSHLMCLNMLIVFCVWMELNWHQFEDLFFDIFALLL